MRVVIMFDDRPPVTLRLNCTVKEVPFELKARGFTGHYKVRCYTGRNKQKGNHRKNFRPVKAWSNHRMLDN